MAYEVSYYLDSQLADQGPGVRWQHTRRKVQREKQMFSASESRKTLVYEELKWKYQSRKTLVYEELMEVKIPKNALSINSI
jgi:hypothetical protein